MSKEGNITGLVEYSKAGRVLKMCREEINILRVNTREKWLVNGDIHRRVQGLELCEKEGNYRIYF